MTDGQLRLGVLKVGIELHRQLKTEHKLFCQCPVKPAIKSLSQKDGLNQHQFLRKLRPSESEMGEVDPAALFEAKRGGWIKYHSDRDTSCLVEADEEPPHEVNKEALEIALVVCRMLKARVVDEVHVMRKIVIDGSNTSGFQRTMVVGFDGWLDWSDGSDLGVGVQTITLEEDAARIIQSDGTKEYSLDRLGIPLIEVSLSPVIAEPQQVQKLAEHLGRILKNTGRVEGGLGTVRQDINISVDGGAIIEVKGVQQLDLVSKVVDFEWKRQSWLNQLASELRLKGLSQADFETSETDVSDILSGFDRGWINEKLTRGEKCYAMLVPKFSGYFAREPHRNMRLGKELSDVARQFGLGGLTHSDELPSDLITSEHVKEIMKRLKGEAGDGFIILVGEPSRLQYAFNALRRRLKQSLEGCPAETRAATADGETRFIRPRPGSARMYPETDIEPVKITSEDIRKADSSIPEPWEKKLESLAKNYSLSKEQALKLMDSEHLDLFLRTCKETDLQPSFVAAVITEGLVSLRREGLDVSQNINDDLLFELFASISKGAIAKEASLDILRLLAKGESSDLRKATFKLGLQRLDKGELERIISEVVNKQKELIFEKGERAFAPLMGMVMEKVRGKVDGAVVSSELRKAIADKLSKKD